MPGRSTTSSWRFPPRTDEIQFDEKWSFVCKKQEHCDPDDPADDHRGDWWDHVAYDPEHRLVVQHRVVEALGMQGVGLGAGELPAPFVGDRHLGQS